MIHPAKFQTRFRLGLNYFPKSKAILTANQIVITGADYAIYNDVPEDPNSTLMWYLASPRTELEMWAKENMRHDARMVVITHDVETAIRPCSSFRVALEFDSDHDFIIFKMFRTDG